MLRAVKLSLELATDTKKRQVRALLYRFRACVDKYIYLIWHHGGTLDKATADYVPLGHLTFRQRAHALKQALAIVSSTRASQKALGNEPSCPRFKGSMTVSEHIAELETSRSSSFDYSLHLATLRRYKKISIPVKSTKVLNSWLAKPLARLKKGCTIGERNSNLFTIVWVELPDLPPKEKGKQIGVDIGMNKLLATSDGAFLGEETKKLCAKVGRCKPGSKNKKGMC